MTAVTPGRAAYGCPECGSPEPRYPASTMTCQHQFHVMARAIWRVFPFPPGDAGPKHREAVSDALRAVGDYVDAVAAQQPLPAPGGDFPGWDGSTGVASTAPRWSTQPAPGRALFNVETGLLDSKQERHPGREVNLLADDEREPPECLASHCPPPGRECDYPECAPTAAELARFAAAGGPRRFVPVAEHVEYVKANQQLARSLHEATEPLLHGTAAEQKLGRELRERHGLEP